MLRGVIKFYSDRRGYGFISCDETGSAALPATGSDVYVHYSQVREPDVLSEGQVVTFDIRDGTRGPEAVNVQLET